MDQIMFAGLVVGSIVGALCVAIGLFIEGLRTSVSSNHCIMKQFPEPWDAILICGAAGVACCIYCAFWVFFVPITILFFGGRFCGKYVANYSVEKKEGVPPYPIADIS